MLLVEAISAIQLKYKKRIKNSDLAEKLNVTRQYIGRFETNNIELPQRLIEKIETAYNIKFNLASSGTLDGSFEIPYWDGVRDFEFAKRTDISSMWEDKEFIRSMNKSCEDIRIIRIFNKKMDGGTYPYRENDIAYLDLGDTDYSDGGVYLFSTKTGGMKHLFIGSLNPNIDGDVVITYKNAVTLQKTRTLAELKAINFRIYGRIFYNKTITGQTIS